MFCFPGLTIINNSINHPNHEINKYKLHIFLLNNYHSPFFLIDREGKEHIWHLVLEWGGKFFQNHNQIQIMSHWGLINSLNPSPSFSVSISLLGLGTFPSNRFFLHPFLSILRASTGIFGTVPLTHLLSLVSLGSPCRPQAEWPSSDTARLMFQPQSSIFTTWLLRVPRTESSLCPWL